MTAFTITTAHNEARLTATRDYADSGAAHSTIKFYDASAVLLVTVTLAKPCGSIAANTLTLAQQDSSGDLIATTGSAASAKWFNGAGVEIASGAVTDGAGAGPFKLQGSSGTTLYAGGKALLGTTGIT